MTSGSEIVHFEEGDKLISGLEYKYVYPDIAFYKFTPTFIRFNVSYESGDIGRVVNIDEKIYIISSQIILRHDVEQLIIRARYVDDRYISASNLDRIDENDDEIRVKCYEISMKFVEQIKHEAELYKKMYTSIKTAYEAKVKQVTDNVDNNDENIKEINSNEINKKFNNHHHFG